MKFSRLLFQLAVSTRLTAVTEFGYAPEGLIKTPSATEAESENRKSKGVSGTSGTLSQEMRSGYIERRVPALLKTPSSVETEGGVMEIRPGCDGHYKLRDQIAMLPTPRVCTAMGATITPESAHAENRFPNLETVVGRAMLPTPQADKITESGEIINADGTEWDGQKKPHSKTTGRPITTALADKVGTSRGLKLQPAFVEWMMGYPLGFTAVESQDSRHLVTR